ncbi:MAG: hypothetical protein H7836_18375, partial [Magnetococcus sp. YQC-3]
MSDANDFVISNNNATSDNFSSIAFYNGSSAVAAIQAIYDRAGTNDGGLAFLVRNPAGQIKRAMRITSDANIGIGTITPRTKLDINGNLWVDGNYLNGYYIPDLNKYNSTTSTITDTNWQTSWSTFDSNMKNQYREYAVDLNTTETIGANIDGT